MNVVYPGPWDTLARCRIYDIEWDELEGESWAHRPTMEASAVYWQSTVSPGVKCACCKRISNTPLETFISIHSGRVIGFCGKCLHLHTRMMVLSRKGILQDDMETDYALFPDSVSGRKEFIKTVSTMLSENIHDAVTKGLIDESDGLKTVTALNALTAKL